MPALLDQAALAKIAWQAREYILSQVLSWAMAMQLLIISGLVLLSYHMTQAAQAWCQRQQEKCPAPERTCADLAAFRSFIEIIRPFLAFLFIGLAWRLARHFDLARDGLYTAAIICLALTAVRFVTGQMQNRLWAGILTAVIWFWAALYMFHISDHWLNFLQQIDFAVGQVQLSLLTIIQALALALVLYWLTRKVLLIWRFWLTMVSDLPPAMQILFAKLGAIAWISASVALVFHYLGLDLTLFTLFSGGLGLGLGFGLQKVFANLISGFILLADKSIKPGDVIQLGDKYGWINFLGSRYTSVISRDGLEHLIPNENLVTGEVINWSHSHNLVRLHLPVGVSYATDLTQARDLMLAVAARTPRVLQEPPPACRLVGFGDNAINLELRAWIKDPQHGLGNVKSELYWGIWEEFRQHHIEIPFPQRDVHLKSVPEIRTRTASEEK